MAEGEYRPSQYNKAWTSLTLAVLIIVASWFGWHTDWLSENAITTILALLSPLLVAIVPNRN